MKSGAAAAAPFFMGPYFLAPSVLLSLLFWWPLRCFSQAKAPAAPLMIVAAISAKEKTLFMGWRSGCYDSRHPMASWPCLLTAIRSIMGVCMWLHDQRQLPTGTLS